MGHNLYCHAAVGRAGLGNMLVPWAMAELFRRDHGAAMLAPQWAKPRLGPLLRRERDARFYVGLFQSRGYIRGLRRWRVLARAQRIESQDFLPSPAPAGRDRLVVFRFPSSGLGGLGPHREFLAGRLHDILSDAVKQRLAAQPGSIPIAAHIRRGDRPPLPFGQPFGDDWLPGMPTEWFVGAIKHLRALAGRSVPVTVFTDADPATIRPVLDLPDVSLAPPNPSIVDILLLSRARVLISTGSSTFSGWASFLGGMPTLYYPGLLERLRADYTLGIPTDLAGAAAPQAAGTLQKALDQGVRAL
jgi:hypothetical protein